MQTIARVVVESPLPHLDRPFDYLIPEHLIGVVTTGSRVRVPFAGRLVSAVVTSLADEASPGVTPARIKSSAGLPTFTDTALDLARDVAQRYGGSLWDVLRLMAPPRVASLESRAWGEAPTTPRWGDLAARWQGPDISATRVAWQAPLGNTRTVLPAAALLGMAAGILATSPRGSVLIVVPDARCAQALHAELQAVGLSPWTHRHAGDYLVLDHEAGATARYAGYMGAMHGEVRLIIGTRSVALQPVPRLAGMVMWDDGSDLYAEPHAPYFHARTVAAMRASEEGVSLALCAYAPSVDAIALVKHGFARQIPSSARDVLDGAPSVEIIDDDKRDHDGGASRHWMPSLVWRNLVAAAASGVVGILVPRAGYVTSVSCADCGAWASCIECGGSLALAGPGQAPQCTVCGRMHNNWHCVECQGSRLRAARQGVQAIGEQLQRMATGVPVLVSSAATGVMDELEPLTGLVVATPGALPTVPGGYASLVIVGADAVGATGLGGELLALRWWANACALVRSRGDGGRVFVVGEVLPAVRHAMRTWDTWGAAESAYAERRELGLPPVRRAIVVEGDTRALEAVARTQVGGSRLEQHPEAILASQGTVATILVSRTRAQEVVEALRNLVVERSRAGDTPLRMRVDATL